jgi:hypothetical protein
MAQGIGRSDMAGLVGETVYIAHTYATKTGLNAHLAEVVGYIQLVKREPRPEAIALEVDQRLALPL